MPMPGRQRVGFWVRVAVIIIKPLTTALFKLRWHHLERIPRHGGALLVVNHISPVDTIAIARLVWDAGRVPRFLANDKVFDYPLLGPIARGAGQIPVHRGTAQAARALEHAGEALEAGEIVVIYPEGGITGDPNYWPMQGRTGVARLALDCPDVPVIPVGQWGAHKTWGRHAKIRLFPRHTVRGFVGEPIGLRHHRGLQPAQSELRALTDEIMAAVTTQVELARGESRPDTTQPDGRESGLAG